MDGAMLTLALFLASHIVLGIVWSVRLEGKVNVAQQARDDLKEFLKILIDTQFADVSRRLDRIERSMNGTLLKH
jgi:hypothetical protein